MAVAEGNCNLYVKGLPANIPQEAIEEIFSNYGEVASVRITQSNGISDDGSGMTVALVRMSAGDQAEWLVENLDGNIPEGLANPISCKFSQNQSGKGKGKFKDPWAASPYGAGAKGCAGKGAPAAFDGWGGAGGGAWGKAGGNGGGKGAKPDTRPLIPGLDARIHDSIPSNLYVKNLPPHADELYLYKVFAPFGSVLSVRLIPRDSYSIGFVKYAEEMEAQTAIEGVSGTELTDGTKLHVALKQEQGGKGGDEA